MTSWVVIGRDESCMDMVRAGRPENLDKPSIIFYGVL
jgi:hypothetical protein